MNSIELRKMVGRFAEKAKHAQGQPSAADITTARELFDLRKEFLPSEISSNVKVKWHEDPNWNSWPSLAEFFASYYAAIVELQNRLQAPLAEMRLRGI
jgi:hypothetical protein